MGLDELLKSVELQRLFHEVKRVSFHIQGSYSLGPSCLGVEIKLISDFEIMNVFKELFG